MYPTESKVHRTLGINIGPSPADRIARPASPPPSPASSLSTSERSPRTRQDAFTSPQTESARHVASKVPEDAHTRWSTAPPSAVKKKKSRQWRDSPMLAAQWNEMPSTNEQVHGTMNTLGKPTKKQETSKTAARRLASETQESKHLVHRLEKSMDMDYYAEKPLPPTPTPSSSELPPPPPPPPPSSPAALVKGWRFWAVFATLCAGQLLYALETTVTATALPAIVRELQSGENYVWVLNGFLLTSTISQPLYGQFASIWGRRWPTIFAVALFTLGSALSGSANSTTGLIAGRVVQGLGGGGIMVMTQLIISDLFSVRERGRYLGIMYGVFGIGLMIGPVMGGEIVQYTTWRWVFWVNIPFGVVILGAQYAFLQVTYTRVATFREKVRRIDWVGNLLLIASVGSVLVALSWADTRYPWSSPQVLAPLVVGVVGTVLFHAFEASPWCRIPTLPPRLFTNRTCAAALMLAFLQMVLTFWRTYFLPTYFQSVLLLSPSRSGVLLLPAFAAMMPASVLAGHVLTKTGRYKPIHIFGLGTMLVATGLYTQFSRSSSLLEIVVFQLLAGLSTGCCLTTLLPAAQADMPQSLVAAVTGGFGFARTYGSVWGVAIPAAIFNARFEVLRGRIADEGVREALGGGRAYSHVSNLFIEALDEKTKWEVVSVYEETMKMVWQIAFGFSVLCLVLVFLEKEVRMDVTVESEFGMKEKGVGKERFEKV